MAPGACSTDRTGWAGTRQTARGIAQHRRLQREGSPHPPRAFLSPPPHRRKEVQILEPDRSCANRTGHLDVLTIEGRISVDIFLYGHVLFLPWHALLRLLTLLTPWRNLGGATS